MHGVIYRNIVIHRVLAKVCVCVHGVCGVCVCVYPLQILQYSISLMIPVINMKIMVMVLNVIRAAIEVVNTLKQSMLQCPCYAEWYSIFTLVIVVGNTEHVL